jgi:bile acid:Na+ symporter, BASS family
MQDTLLTSLFLPLALAFIMLGMGLTLTVKDFKNIVVFPKAIFLGLFTQIILLPIIGFALIQFFGLSGTMAVGLMILAACPGGPTSNLITHLSRGDTALSISLTAVSSVITVATIPLIVNYSIQFFGEAGSITLPVGETIIQIMGVTIIPVSIGMFLKHKFPILSLKADKPVRKASTLFFILIIAAAILKEKESLPAFFVQAGPVTLILNIVTLLTGFYLAKAFFLPKAQQISISIESGIQNGTLGIMIAATLLKNSEMTIPIAIYSILMFLTASVVIFLSTRKSRPTL